MMKATNFFPLLLCLLATSLFSQSNINQSLSVNPSGAAADASAQLDVSATDKGMLVPRMTSAQRTAIASPATGLLVFDTTTGGFWFYNGTAWVDLSSPRVLADADGDTKVQVEESADEDIIRFDLDGTENMILRKNASGITRLELPTTIENTFVGQSAGSANTTGSANTAMGREALFLNTTGFSNTATGGSALRSNTTGNYNTAIGEDALFSNTSGTFNTAQGEDAMRSNTSGSRNTAQGESALFFNTTGSANTAVGAFAMYRNTIRNNLVAVGDSALYNNGLGVTMPFQAINNVALGSKALYANTTGGANTASGALALYANTTGAGNTANGAVALYSNTTGYNNTANGGQALYLNTTGINNTASGVSALNDNTTGDNNTAFGFDAMDSNTTGSNNTAIGAEADMSSGTQNNAAAFGSGAIAGSSNRIRIGNTGVSVIEGQVDWTWPSDARFKFNVDDATVPGLAFIEKLRPVTYQFDTRRFDEHLMQLMPDSIRQRRMAKQNYAAGTARVQTGFLAQEVEQVCKDLNFQFSGLHVPESETDNYGLAYGSFVPLLVKAVQEMEEIRKLEIGKLTSQNERLEAENAALKSQLERITAALAGAGIVVEK